MKNMNNKYYTPELEEFHNGFEFEVLGDTQWQKETFGSSYLRAEDYCSDYKTRVKHLDQEDIESLGFKRSNLEKSIYLSSSKIKLYPHLESYTIGINFNQGINTHCLIFFVPDEHNIPAGVNLFVGQIKNKSELKRILKQLGIL